MADKAGVDLDALRGEPLLHAAIEDIQFHQRRAAERIDQNGDLVAGDR